ncbi:uncharacterized protein N7483_010913 [Penicillium malachiteum]|uniref:uncharacterized protein n=1 Tax=Penicillium malachiteum TaxID=1324776 RepID=UPI00254982BC|nr:uncharacterized protein N7483_010913 [Penicillium malachiteum]KAJ5713732.1 hypothetical protein N7483_010913 [Penicillium malachiteum]
MDSKNTESIIQSYVTPSDQPPVFSACNGVEKPLLIVLLTTLSPELHRKLVHYYKATLSETVDIQTWAPSGALLQSIAKQGPHIDSLGNIYALAVFLHRSGWTGFVVADELTKRQVTTTCRVGEDTSISVVVVTVQSEAATPTQPRVSARRTNPDFKDEVKLSELSSGTVKEVHRVQDKTPAYFWSEVGGLLLDSDHSVFAPNTTDCLGWEKYTESLKMPQELPPSRPGQTSPLHLNNDNTVVDMPIWDRPQCAEHMHIFLFFPTTAEDFQIMQSIIQEALSKHLEGNPFRPTNMTVELIGLEKHKIKSRRELMIFRAESYKQQVLFEPFYFLMDPIKNATDIENATFGYCRDEDPAAFIALTSFAGMVNFFPWISPRIQWHLQRQKLSGTKEIEFLHSPGIPFYHNPFPWEACQPHEDSFDWIPVFYLTKHLTAEEDGIVKAEINLDIFGEPGEHVASCYVPWEAEEDATLEDIWELILMQHRRTGFVPDTFFCIDRQALESHDFLTVEADVFYKETGEEYPDLLKDLEYPLLRGFWYCRISGDMCHDAKVQRGIDNMAFDELTREKPKWFRRPDWPAS